MLATSRVGSQRIERERCTELLSKSDLSFEKTEGMLAFPRRCWNQFCDRRTRLSDRDFLSQCDPLENAGKLSLRLMNVDFHKGEYD